jgi:hypothetical protein
VADEPRSDPNDDHDETSRNMCRVGEVMPVVTGVPASTRASGCSAGGQLVVEAAGAGGVGLLDVELLESDELDAPDVLDALDEPDDESLEELLLDDVLDDDDPRLSVL